MIVDGVGGGLGQYLLQLGQFSGPNGLDGAETLQKQLFPRFPHTGNAVQLGAVGVFGVLWWW